MRTALKTVSGLGAVLGVVFLVGMRRKAAWLQDPMRRLQRDLVRKPDLVKGGKPGARTSLIHHVGRRSGAAYVTPIGARSVPGGFVIALPYTARTDWARNVLAAGEAVVEHDGRRHRVVAPRVAPYGDVADLLPTGERVVARVFDLREFLRLDLAD